MDTKYHVRLSPGVRTPHRRLPPLRIPRRRIPIVRLSPGMHTPHGRLPPLPSTNTNGLKAPIPKSNSNGSKSSSKGNLGIKNNSKYNRGKKNSSSSRLSIGRSGSDEIIEDGISNGELEMLMNLQNKEINNTISVKEQKKLRALIKKLNERWSGNS
jgi:hypothetical protein